MLILAMELAKHSLLLPKPILGRLFNYIDCIWFLKTSAGKFTNEFHRFTEQGTHIYLELCVGVTAPRICHAGVVTELSSEK